MVPPRRVSLMIYEGGWAEDEPAEKDVKSEGVMQPWYEERKEQELRMWAIERAIASEPALVFSTPQKTISSAQKILDFIKGVKE
jgi:hypothetical protein